MSKPRKTVRLADVIDRANAMLADSADDRTEGRIAIAVFLESVLMDANAYRGFRYTDGTLDVPDETRRRYYTARELTQ